MGSKRLVHLMFFGAGIVAAVVLVQAVDWIWGYFAKPPTMYVDAIALSVSSVATFLAWRNPMAFSTASEVAVELEKVTWPTGRETKAATLIVIVTVIIGAAVLSTYDLVWSWLTGLVYG